MRFVASATGAFAGGCLHGGRRRHHRDVQQRRLARGSCAFTGRHRASLGSPDAFRRQRHGGIRGGLLPRVPPLGAHAVLIGEESPQNVVAVVEKLRRSDEHLLP